MQSIMRCSDAGRAITKQNEGLRLSAYKDSVGLYTIGWGHAETNPRPARGLVNGDYQATRPCEGMTITLAEAERLFAEDMAEVEKGVSALITATSDPSQGTFDALCDMGFQFSVHKLEGSKVIAAINFNPRSTRVMEAMLLWMRAGGKPMQALLMRRYRNACQCMGLSVPPMLWDKNKFPFDTLPNGEIDTGRTIPLDMVFAMARNPDAAPIPAEPPPTSKPDPSPTPPVGETKQNTLPIDSEPLPHEAEASPALPLQPAVPASPLVPPGVDARFAPDKPVAVTVETVSVVAVKPLSPNTKPVDAAPHGLDPMAGAKPIEESDRVKALHLERVGETIIRMSGVGFLGTGAKTIAGNVMRDPWLMAAVEGAAASLLGLAVGFVLTKYAAHQRAKANATAIQFLF